MCHAKLRIAAATKELVASYDFDAITVSTITQAAGLKRRQTFYDYFRDKYDVLEWIYRTEVTEVAPNCTSYVNWPSTLRRMLTYFFENRRFYATVLQIDERNAPEEIIEQHIAQMIGTIFSDLAATEHLNADDEYCAFLQRMLSTALLQEITAFLTQAQSEEPSTSQTATQMRAQSQSLLIETEVANIRRYIEDGINGLLLRTGRISEYLHSAEK